MTTFAPPVNYAQVRRCLVQAICNMTQLSANQVIRYQAQGPVQPRPKLPYITFQYKTAAIRENYDSILPSKNEDDTLWRYVGERGITVDLMVYGNDQDEAYSYALAMQTALQQQPTSDILDAGGLSLWTVGNVTDMTTLLGTGFEGRALLECELWIGTSQLVDLGRMETVTVQGTIDDGAGHQRFATVTATLKP